jgi:acetoin utilization deacetylase AcuC-like enzyme
VLFVSTHAYGDDFYPYSGAPTSVENILNIPLRVGFNREEFHQACERVYARIEAHKPDFLFLSAGMDARHRDIIMRESSDKAHGANDDSGLTTSDYRALSFKLGKLASRLCEGRVLSLLEGGYGEDDLAECCLAHVQGIAQANFHDAATAGE